VPGLTQPWREAWTTAQYGPAGFYRRGEAPARHFRTSVHASALFAGAILGLLRRVDHALGQPDALDLVDVGAGRAELLLTVQELAEPEMRGRLRLTAVEVTDRPLNLPAGIGWRAEVPPLTGLLVANEWLDDVPVEVVEQTEDGPRLVLVAPDGEESLGGLPSREDAAWLARWWPGWAPPGADSGTAVQVGDRAEVGRGRDDAWAAAVRRVRRGVAVTIDYAHRRDDRPSHGTLSGYRDGRAVRPVPDGSCNLTAHVALDACAAAGSRAGATETLLTTQREALRALGVSGAQPPVDLARTDPERYLRELAAAGQAAELTDAAGLGAFGWLAQAVEVPMPVAG
jgi:SAM-dependent MidA family methyltransferase